MKRNSIFFSQKHILVNFLAPGSIQKLMFYLCYISFGIKFSIYCIDLILQVINNIIFSHQAEDRNTCLKHTHLILYRNLCAYVELLNTFDLSS